MVAANPSRRRPNRLVDLQAMKQEARLLNRFRHDFTYRSIRDRLSSACGVKDIDLLDGLMSLGVTGDNFEALRYAPLAVIAWSNGSVSQSERFRATKALFEQDLIRSPGASKLFRSWLTSKPSDELLEIWKRFTAYQLRRKRTGRDVVFGGTLRAMGLQVANVASGRLNVERISDSAREILGQISEVYGLHEVAA